MTVLKRASLVILGLAAVALGIWIIWRQAGAVETIVTLVALGFVIVFFQTPVEQTRHRAQQLLWLFPLGAYFLTSLGVDLFSSEVGTFSFYETAAQVIPILVLAMTVELRLFGQHATNVQGQAAAGLLTILFLGFGEYYCLTALATNALSEQAFSSTTASLLSGFVGLIVGAFAATR